MDFVFWMLRTFFNKVFALLLIYMWTFLLALGSAALVRYDLNPYAVVLGVMSALTFFMTLPVAIEVRSRDMQTWIDKAEHSWGKVVQAKKQKRERESKRLDKELGL